MIRRPDSADILLRMAGDGGGGDQWSGEHDELVLSASWLARRVVHDVAAGVPRCVDRQDLHAAALLGLVRAARTFDPGRGVPFLAFARSRMRWAVLDELRSSDHLTRSARRRTREAVPVPATDVFVRLADVDVADPTAATPEGDALECELVESVRAAVARLPARHRAVILGYFVEGREMRDLAVELGVTPSRVSQLCSDGVGKLRARLGVESTTQHRTA